jgi:putative ABC transport system permease protein
MSFLALVARNLARHRTRTVLTVVGIGIGITTVIALGAITSGLKGASEQMAHAGGADFMVAQNGAADLTFSALAERDEQAIAAVPGVARTWGVLMHVARVGGNPFFIAFGARPSDQEQALPPLREGRLPRGANEIALGSRAAADLGLGPGGTVTIERRPLRVVGVYGSDAQWEDGGGYATLATVQELARKPGVVSAVYVIASPGADPEAVEKAVEASSDRFAAISTADEYASVDQGMKVLDAANLAISLLAVVIGAIGVMNTMIMSVFERTREIGILRAVGWRGARIVRMVLSESLILCLVATVVGVAAGIAATRAVLLVPAISTFLEPAYPPAIFVRALVIAVGVALAGALYPALRAVRLSPMEALRHE